MTDQIYSGAVMVKIRHAKKDRRSRELKLAMLAVVKIRAANLDKKQNRQNHIQHRENNVLNLCFRVIPSALYRRGYIARGENRHTRTGNHGSDEQNKAQNQAGFSLIHKSFLLIFSAFRCP